MHKGKHTQSALLVCSQGADSAGSQPLLKCGFLDPADTKSCHVAFRPAAGRRAVLL